MDLSPNDTYMDTGCPGIFFAARKGKAGKNEKRIIFTA